MNLLSNVVHAVPLQKFVQAFLQNFLCGFQFDHAQATVLGDNLFEVIDAHVLHAGEFADGGFGIARATEVDDKARSYGEYAFF